MSPSPLTLILPCSTVSISADRIQSSTENVEAILDRRQAIDIAISNAQRGDVLLIAGKGHETSQIVGDVHIAFDDRRVAREFLALREAGVLA